MPKIKYFLYARKSSESEDRQVASIESQLDELTKLAKREGLEIVDVLTESQSAKAPGRSVFNKMIERINSGGTQGIICWKLDRLARNPVDGGQINWMLQQGVIKHIQTHERSYYPTDNVLMMSVELGMANQFIRDLTENTKRGLRAKLEKGWFPGTAPLGYLNNKFKERGEKDIIKDPERFNLVRKLWDILLGGQYSIQKIAEIGEKELGLKSKRMAKGLHKSKFYELFTNPFYYGCFKYAGVLYEGKHEAMISEDEFYRAQLILGNRSKTHMTHKFAFTGMIRCGECGSMITAEDKIKRTKSGSVHYYTYYHCTKRRVPNCSQKYIEKKELERQILEILGKIEIPPQFHGWIIKEINLEAEKESGDRNIVLRQQQKNYQNCIRKIDNLIEMRAGEEISQEEFLEKKVVLMKEKIRLQELLNDTDNRINNWISKAEGLFNFARDAKKRFENGTLEEKRVILSNLGSNLVLKDEKLAILIQKPLILVEEAAKEVKTIHKGLEPVQNGKIELNFDKIYSKNSLLGARRDSNAQPLRPQRSALPLSYGHRSAPGKNRTYISGLEGQRSIH